MKKLFNNKSFILISPCAGWQTKEWPPKMYAALANLLQEKFNIFCAVIWAGQREKKIALQITDNSKALFLPETDINEMLAFIEKSTLFIGGDTGPMHAANFMGIPVAALYFASDSIRNGPWFQPAVTITPPIICRPCKKRTCPRPLCLEKLSASDVFNAISQRFEGLFHEKG
jgi:ADP-heptose:LPS heptosyltransferase